MSRLIFSNNTSIVSRFTTYCNNAGFNKYTPFNDHGVYGSIFKKLKIDDDNFLNKDGYSIAIVGTFFYKGISGLPALEQIVDDFNGDISLIRDNMNGAYACVIIKNNSLYAFSDAAGIYYFYYSFDNKANEWVVGTSLYGLAKVTGKTKINEFNLLEACFQGCIIGSDTIFDDIYKIEGDYCMVVNLKENTMEKMTMSKKVEVDERGVDDLIKGASEGCRKITKIIKQRFGEHGVSVLLTGGLDSRIVMSSLLSENISPAAYYGVGNSPLAPTTQNDYEVVKKYCEKFNLPFHEMDWSIPEKIDIHWDKYIEKYGEIGMMYASSPNVYEGLEEITEDCVLLGYFGESFRNNFLVEQKRNLLFTIEQIFDQFYFTGRDMKNILGNDYHEYVRKLTDKWRKKLEPYLSNNKLPQDLFSVVDYFKRRYSDTLVVNFLNQSRYSFSMLSEPDIIRYSFIPTNIKDNAGFIIKLTNALFPDVLSIPIYSRYKYQKIDWEKMELVYTKEPYWMKFVRIPFVFRFLKKMKSLIKGEKKNTFLPQDMLFTQSKEDIVDQVNDILKKVSPRKYNIDVNNSDYLPKDVKYAFFATMATKLNSKQQKL